MNVAEQQLSATCGQIQLQLLFHSCTGVPYSIHVTLAEKPQPTSQGHLVVSLVGSLCTSPPLHLLPLSKPDLLPSKTEVYSVHTPDVGSVDTIKVS